MTENTITVRLKAIRKRLKVLDSALKDAIVGECDRATYMHNACVNMWAWYGMYDIVSYSATEWFDLEYGVYAAHMGR